MATARDRAAAGVLYKARAPPHERAPVPVLPLPPSLSTRALLLSPQRNQSQQRLIKAAGRCASISSSPGQAAPMAFIGVGGRSHGLPLLLLLLLLSDVLSLRAPDAAAAATPGLVFHVGGPRGWRVPDATTNYGSWAMNNRFHVGDELYFKYADDSVLVVDRAAFDACNATGPVAAFDDGATTFRLDRPGFFCFISGEPGHCEEGQRLVVRVMVHPAAAAAAAAPGPAQGPAAAAASAASQPGHGGSAGGGRPWQSSGSAATVAATAGVAVASATAAVVLVLTFQ